MKILSKELVALLSAAFVVASAPAISANVPEIVNSFPDINPVYVGLLTTIPSLFLILGVFLTGTVEKKVGRKTTILIGLVGVGVFGTLPAWYQGSFLILFLSRCLLGLGIGFFNRLIIQIISSLFQEDSAKKAKALGLESASEGLGGIIMTVSVGQLIKFSWQLSFTVYALAFLGVILIYRYLPETKPSDEPDELIEQEITPLSRERKIKTISLGIILFSIVILFINYNLQITPLLLEKGIGAATQGSNVIAAMAAGAFIAGNLFGKTYSFLGSWVLPIATLLAGTFIFLASQSDSMTLTLIYSLGLGFSFRNIMPYFMFILTSGGEEGAKFGTTIVLVAYNLGATFSPYISQMTSQLSIGETVSMQLIITSVLLWVIGLITLVFNRFMKVVH